MIDWKSRLVYDQKCIFRSSLKAYIRSTVCCNSLGGIGSFFMFLLPSDWLETVFETPPCLLGVNESPGYNSIELPTRWPAQHGIWAPLIFEEVAPWGACFKYRHHLTNFSFYKTNLWTLQRTFLPHTRHLYAYEKPPVWCTHINIGTKWFTMMMSWKVVSKLRFMFSALFLWCMSCKA